MTTNRQSANATGSPSVTEPLVCALIALLLSAGLAFWFLELDPSRLDDHLPSDPGDPVLNLVLLQWVADRLPHGLRRFWDGNFYHPTPHVIALSDHFLGPGVVATASGLLPQRPIAAYNFLFLSAFLLTAASTAWVARRSGSSRAAALVASVAFSWSSYRLAQQAHLQVLLAAAIPLTLWFAHRLLEERRRRDAVLFLACYLFQISGGLYLAYLLHLALAAVAMAHRRDLVEVVRRPRERRRLAATFLVAGLGATAIFLPYLVLSSRLGLERRVGEIREFAATWASWLSVDPRHWLFGELTTRWARAENGLFPGLVTSGLAAVALVALQRRRRSAATGAVATPVSLVLVVVGGALTVAGFVLADLHTWTGLDRVEVWRGLTVATDGYSNGVLLAWTGMVSLALLWRRRSGSWPFALRGWPPWERALAWIALGFFALSFPVFFAPLTLVLPGLAALRVPTRGYTFLSFALAIFAARGLDRLTSGDRRGRRWALALAALLLLAVELRTPIPWVRWQQRDEIPRIEASIAALSEVEAVLHLPMREPRALETLYMDGSTVHWKPIANGYSGHFPPIYLELRRRFGEERWKPENFDRLLELGVTHVVLHPYLEPTLRERRRWRRWERHFASGPDVRLELVERIGGDRLHRIVPSRLGGGAERARMGGRE